MSVPIDQLPPIDGSKQDNLADSILDDMRSSGTPYVDPQQYEARMEQIQQQQPPPLPEEDYYEYEQSMSFTDRLLFESKMPFIVALIIYFSSLASVNRTLIQIIPYLGSAVGLNEYGVAVKALLGALIFWIIVRFFL